MDWPPPEMDYNLRGFDKYHHIIQYSTEENRTVKICRCWQSKRFPYCDDTHKVLIEAGDNAGPYVAKVQGTRTTQNVNANHLTKQVRSQLPRGAAFFTLGFGVVGLACAAASAHARGHRWRVEVGFDVGGAAPAPRPSNA
mmetsp:Transcript_49419/g.127536  ORF Transcript_49419/g.127536 Transcript_49419/m.127536 type:complete len:140 (-) Transcript_49419:215-634(-)